jgi:hypothetical protein
MADFGASGNVRRGENVCQLDFATQAIAVATAPLGELPAASAFPRNPVGSVAAATASQEHR